MSWSVYVLQCRDGSLYCGATTSVLRRYREHSRGKGAKYTRSRRPVNLVAAWTYDDKIEALRAEVSFKKLSRDAKLEVIEAFRGNPEHVRCGGRSLWHEINFASLGEVHE